MGKIRRFLTGGAKPGTQADTKQGLQQQYTAACAEEGHIRFQQKAHERRLRALDGIREDLQRRLDVVDAREKAEARRLDVVDAREKAEAARKAAHNVKKAPEGVPTAPPEAPGPEAQA